MTVVAVVAELDNEATNASDMLTTPAYLKKVAARSDCEVVDSDGSHLR